MYRCYTCTSVAHTEACILVNKFVIRLLEARQYILDQDSASVQRLWAEFGVNPLYFCGKTAEKTNLAFCTQRSFLSDKA